MTLLATLSLTLTLILTLAQGEALCTEDEGLVMDVTQFSGHSFFLFLSLSHLYLYLIVCSFH